MMAAIKCLLAVLLALGAECLRDVRLDIKPEQVAVGGSVTITCMYDTDGAPLYAVKFYKGRREFYRYMPHDNPAAVVFPLLGINVDLSESDANRVVLKGVSRKLSGDFSCEVSEDAPSFSTAVVSKQLLVAILPSQKPMLHTRRAKYEAGDVLVANCTAALSRPAANLTFFINELPVPQSTIRVHPPRIELTSSQEDSSEFPLESSSVGLEIRLQRSHFRPDRVNRLYCQQRVLNLSVHNSDPFILSVPPTTPSPPPTTPKEDTIAEPVPERVTSPNHSSTCVKKKDPTALIATAIFICLAMQMAMIR
ncbi:uncharacterized protein LOC124153337 [Ischnura elegans]|uniref:uncharacterized protein LOC124153337 n=1 Tax=Ischnura elegans TaxID=197161 RepID=UPI001ED880BE|nr:uncharacterized protein LOC124153337 [Ischnura elegans]